ncbi:hypothetical protein OHA70_33420 [Kribbella sp. NBC_00382]|uniref:hypothetical protein n=1 Tax=Kribbella sp. NBC_00382 TaxID=2975967 RepID=UPI002E1D9CF6
MAGQWWTDDDQLLEVLRDALTSASEMPPGFVEAGKAVYAWRTIDAELAALTYDSAWEGAEVGATRAAESASLRRLTFASETLSIELELTGDEILGQVSPPQAGTVQLAAGADDLGTIPVDDLGFFVVRPVPSRPFRIICRTDSGAAALTGWVSP